MQKIKFISETIVFNGAIATGFITEAINKVINEKKVLGIAFYETANSSGCDYDLSVSDSANTLQDFTTKYDYLALIAGNILRNIPFSEAYKPYVTNGNGNKIKVGIKFNSALAAGQSLTLKVVIKTED